MERISVALVGKFTGVLLTLILALMFIVVSRADAGQNPTLQIGCQFVKTATMDPMFKPEFPHRHDFFAHPGIKADSTATSLSRDRRTACFKKWYTVSKWLPDVKESGAHLKQVKIVSYYSGVGDQSKLKAPPPGLLYFGNKIDYRCGGDAAVTTVPYGCKAEMFRIRVHFPDCWDRTSLRPESLSYSKKWVCPPGSVRLPKHWMAVHYKNDSGINFPLLVHAGNNEWKSELALHGNSIHSAQRGFYDELKRCVIEAPDFSTRSGCQS